MCVAFRDLGKRKINKDIVTTSCDNFSILTTSYICILIVYIYLRVYKTLPLGKVFIKQVLNTIKYILKHIV